MNYRKKFFADPEYVLRLDKVDPGYKGEHESEAAAKQETEHLRATLSRQQALDAGGKDGTVNHVFTALNPQGTTVVGCKQPTPAERTHDFLLRIHAHTP